MKTILVPLDFSFVSESAVNTASALAEATQSSLVFIHIIQENLFFDGMAMPLVETEEMNNAMIFEARRSLNEYVNKSAIRGISAAAFVVRGHPALRILEKADEVRADLIVMGSHGHGAIYNFLAGSTARGVLKGSHCPIVLVPAAQVNTVGTKNEDVLSKYTEPSIQ